MQIARTLQEAAGFGPSALTIGKFDGVHAAHTALLRRVLNLARERGLRSAAITFDPHPACVVAPDRAPLPLVSLEERCERMAQIGLEQLFILSFTAEVARLSPEEFVSRFIAGVMKARVVLVGENFRFGHRQAGDPAVLRDLGQRYAFETLVASPIKLRGGIVSTSEIRSRIQSGQVAFAARLLERPYSISGEVVPGRGVGSRQTVPTLNLRTAAAVLPRTGVYITRTTDPATGRCWNSITNIGNRPTFDGGELSIETFLLDPLEAAPPVSMKLEFLRRIRDERKFDTPEALKAQILRDVARAQTYFRRLPP